MTQRRSVAIYARISQDRDGAGLGIQRQLQDCRAEAAALGWGVAEEYVDDDVSAYSGRNRPAYQRMLDDIAEGRRDAIITWHMDRLHRQPLELEQLIRVCQTAGMQDLRTVQGSYDLGTGDGMLVARLLAAVAAGESDRKRHRGRRKMLQIAESGEPHGGGTRPFGFAADRKTHDPVEAEVIRAIAARALAGESLPSLGRWLIAEGVTTVTGKTWRSQVIRQLLLNPRNYGMRVHQGQIIGEASWEPIITREQGEALRAVLTRPERAINRAARRYLASGLLRCSLCGNVMFSAPRGDERRYLCRSGHDFGGCGRMAISALPVEQILVEAVLYRLDSPDLHDALAGRVRDDTTATQLAADIAADNQTLEDLADEYGRRMISAGEWRAAREPIRRRVIEAQRRLNGLAGTRHIDSYIGHGSALREQWSELNLDRQRAIVKALIDHVEIRPGRRGARSVDMARIRPVWRL